MKLTNREIRNKVIMQAGVPFHSQYVFLIDMALEIKDRENVQSPKEQNIAVLNKPMESLEGAVPSAPEDNEEEKE